MDKIYSGNTNDKRFSMIENTVLIVDDEEIILESLTQYLIERGFNVIGVENLSSARKILSEKAIDLILLDIKLPDGMGLELLDDVAKLEEKPLVIVMTAYGTVDTAVTAMKKGVYDFIQKPFRTKDIELIIKLALDTRKLDKELKVLVKAQAEKYGITSIIGRSKKIEEIFKIIRKVANSGANSVLILGESGTGKELIARALHYESKRAIWPFVAINCSAIPSNLLESELYGHEKGAFTDAKERKIGLFEKAHKGTLLLDEIGDMSYDLQTKLLRTLEERKIRRIGGTSDISIDIQLIAATNQNLGKLVEEGKFRKDLYYRLKVIEINVPPLRERKEDIIPLAKYFMHQYNRKLNKHFIGFEKSAEEALVNYSYPGNVRELKNIIEKILILEDDKYIKLEHLPEEVRKSDSKIEQKIENIENVYELGLENYVKKQEMFFIKEALKRCNGNKSEAAKLLKIDRSTLRYKIKLYGIE